MRIQISVTNPSDFLNLWRKQPVSKKPCDTVTEDQEKFRKIVRFMMLKKRIKRQALIPRFTRLTLYT